MTTATTFALPTPRADQLRKLARYQDTTAAELLDRLIAQEAERHGMADDLPGFTVGVLAAWHEPAVQFQAPDLPLTHLPARAARALADALDKVSADGGSEIIKAGADRMLVKRVGRGIALAATSDEHGAENVFITKTGLSHGLARDVARIIRKAADKAERGAE